jgi:ABC-2 type transport system ATP-binding protein
MTEGGEREGGIMAVHAGCAIVVEQLTKHFGGLTALDEVSFEVTAGTVFGLLGPNGAGKTTAIRILTTLLRPDRGRASVLGLDVVKDAAAVRYQIGLAGQYATVDEHLTGRENLRLIGRLAQLRRAEFRAQADALLARFGLADAAARPVRTYSGGMRRRLDVAAALVSRPPVLFLDEPTTGLDLLSRNELWVVIRDLVAEGTTVVLTTQYLEEADRLTDRLAVVDNGAVIADDTAASLKRRLGSSVVEIEVADEASAATAASVLALRRGPRPERDGNRIRLISNDSSGVLIDSLHALDVSGLRPTAVQVREPSLDDVFLLLTGHHTEHAEPAAVDRLAAGSAA